jgi:hypothetical protein
MVVFLSSGFFINVVQAIRVARQPRFLNSLRSDNGISLSGKP